MLFQKYSVLAFLFMLFLETFILDYWEKNPQTENQQILDGIIDVTLFDGVVGDITLFTYSF